MIALATADLTGQLLEDPDRPILEAAFASRAAAEFVRWDDESVDWADCQAVVLRSTWDYSFRLPQFQDWLAEVSAVTRLLNSAGTVNWNLDKAYLGHRIPGQPHRLRRRPGRAGCWPGGGEADRLGGQ